MMLENMCEEQPTHLLGRGLILSGNKVCHLAKSIHHYHDGVKALDGGKLTMKSMDTLSHDPLGIGKGCNKLVCFLLSVRFCWQVKQVFTYSSTLSFKLGQ
jgi:hypothetical protein